MIGSQSVISNHLCSAAVNLHSTIYATKIPLVNRTRSFGIIWIGINDPRLLGPWCMKTTDESTLGKDSSITLIHFNPCDLGGLILIYMIPKKPIRVFKSVASKVLNVNLIQLMGRTLFHFQVV